MSHNPPHMRYPFEADIAELPEGVQRAHRFAFNSAVDLQQAVASLKDQVSQMQKTVGVSPTVATVKVGDAIRTRPTPIEPQSASRLPTGGLSVTIVTPKRTAGGKDGAMKFTNGLLTAYTPAT